MKLKGKLEKKDLYKAIIMFPKKVGNPKINKSELSLPIELELEYLK